MCDLQVFIAVCLFHILEPSDLYSLKCCPHSVYPTSCHAAHISYILCIPPASTVKYCSLLYMLLSIGIHNHTSPFLLQDKPNAWTWQGMYIYGALAVGVNKCRWLNCIEEFLVLGRRTFLPGVRSGNIRCAGTCELCVALLLGFSN